MGFLRGVVLEVLPKMFCLGMGHVPHLPGCPILCLDCLLRAMRLPPICLPVAYLSCLPPGPQVSQPRSTENLHFARTIYSLT